MRARAFERSGPLLVAGLGIALLTARISLLGLPPGTRVAAFALLLGAIGAASWLVPASRGSVRRMPRWAVLSIGLAPVLAASAVIGRPPGMPIGTWTLPLALGAAVAEELLFRRLAYAALARRSETLAVVGTAAAFALIHLPLYGVAALPVDLGAGLLFSWQRWAAGSWTVPAATHAAANLLAVIR
jgi:membrane protease YdiL (CAAX protease family)